jgi:tetratricopeptide (TPR) repeat protein
MMDSPLRRTLLALTGVAISALLLRPQISDALVVRGDEFLYRSLPSRALAYYGRALAVDGDDAAAADRFAFVSMMLRDRAALNESLRVTSAYLIRHPEDSVVRMDRAMAYRAAGIPRGALDDFALVGARTGDARALTFAGYAADGLGERSLARRFWRAAIGSQPGFPPAVHALERRR